MKTILYILFFALILLLTLESSAQSKRIPQEGKQRNAVNTRRKTPVKMIEFLVGEWKIDQVVSGKKDVSKTNGDADQTLTFTNDARYILRSGSEKTDSGAYRMNEQLRNLYLESESDKKVREWDVIMKTDTLTLTQAKGVEREGNLKYIYVRTSAASAKEK